MLSWFQEYLEDVNYLADDEMYAQFFMPYTWKNKSKPGEKLSPVAFRCLLMMLVSYVKVLIH